MYGNDVRPINQCEANDGLKSHGALAEFTKSAASQVSALNVEDFARMVVAGIGLLKSVSCLS